MPNAYGFDITNTNLHKEPVFKRYEDVLAGLKAGKASWIAVACGYWYEWSLALGENFFGIDIKNKTVTFFDQGTTKINISTWDQCGRAIAGLLNLPEKSDGTKPALENWKNGVLYFDSFKLSQRDMLDSVNRVLGTTDQDWTIKYEPAEQRYKDALVQFQGGDRMGFAKAIYSRIFYPTGDGDFDSKGLANAALGLPEEDLDEHTKNAIDMVESGWTPFG
jgi:hypothetical protein